MRRSLTATAQRRNVIARSPDMNPPLSTAPSQREGFAVNRVDSARNSRLLTRDGVFRNLDRGRLQQRIRAARFCALKLSDLMKSSDRGTHRHGCGIVLRSFTG